MYLPWRFCVRHDSFGFKVAEGKILVTGLKGLLQEGWHKKVEAFASQIPILP